MRCALRFPALVGLLVLLGQSPGASAHSAVQFPPVSENAALQYWQGFAMMPTLDDDQQKLVQNWATVPLDEAVNKLLDQSQTSLMFLHRGAQKRECDWGLDYRDGPQLYLPHLIRARTLARIAALDARRAFASKDYDRAFDDAVGMITLARYAGQDDTIIDMLVCFAIEEDVVNLVAPYPPEADASYGEAMKLYEALPPSPTLAQAVLGEKRMVSAVLEQLADAEHRRPGSWRQTWRSLLGPDNEDPLQDVVKFGEVRDRLEKLQPIYDELAELVALPPAEFDARYPEFAKRASAASPLAKIFLPAIEKTVAKQRRCEARLAMLLAAMAVVESGPEKLADIKDPFGDGPFEYRKLDQGFELSSKLIQDGRPVTLVIGQKVAAPGQ
jgi:hypothetical protein